MMRKTSQSKKPLRKRVPVRTLRRQSVATDGVADERNELDAEFDAVEIHDVVRQARNGRIAVAELDAF